MKTRFDHAYVVNVLADDHPGFVAAVGGAVESFGGNIDACSQTVLAGHFTLIMVISLPQAQEAARLADEIRRRGRGLEVIARKVDIALDRKGAGDIERFVLTAFGPDRPGIIRRFSQYLAGKDINITDFYGERRDETLVLIGEVEVPAARQIAALQADLEHIGREEGYTVRLQHEDIFVATNQLRLSRRDLQFEGE